MNLILLHWTGEVEQRAIFSFPNKQHWLDAASRFSIEEDTNAIRFEKLKPRQRPGGFLANVQAQ